MNYSYGKRLGSALFPPFLLNIWVVSHQETHPKGRGHAQIFMGRKEIVVGAKKLWKKQCLENRTLRDFFKKKIVFDFQLLLCTITYYYLLLLLLTTTTTTTVCLFVHSFVCLFVIKTSAFGHSRLSTKSSEKNYVWKNLTLRDFFKKNFFRLELRLHIGERTWMYVWIDEWCQFR